MPTGTQWVFAELAFTQFSFPSGVVLISNVLLVYYGFSKSESTFLSCLMNYQLLQSSTWNYLNGWKKRKIIENRFTKFNDGCEYKGLNIKTWQGENVKNKQVLLLEKV